MQAKRLSMQALAFLTALVITSPAARADDAAEMARKLQDPLANIAAIMTDNDIQFNTGDDSTSYVFQVQPVYAFDFPEQGFSFIPRAVIPIIGAGEGANLTMVEDDLPRRGGTTWGVGDIVSQFFFAPKTDASWKWGAGPQLSWRTRTDSDLGGPGWGAGAAGVVVGSITDQVSFAGIVSQLWSYDGDFSQMSIQPTTTYNLESLPGAWVGYTGSITADWTAGSSDTWTVPLGLVVGRTFDLGGGYGIDLSAGPYWNVVKPDNASDWFIKFGISFLLPR